MYTIKPSFKALIPFLVFIGIYLGTGIYLHIKNIPMAFYQLPAPIAAICGIIVAFILLKDTFHEKLNTFLYGCGQEDIITMCLIYLLAGAFSHVTNKIGGVDASVNFSLQYIPPQYIAVGVFCIAAFISTATGTSVGAIVAIGPIAIGLAEKSGIYTPLVLAALIGGSMFGDNLSMISDTTIAATRTQNVAMKDKFRFNLILVVPAALITIILLAIFGSTPNHIDIPLEQVSLIKIIPYFLVLGLAICGINVFLVLLIGILSSGIVGFYHGDFTVLEYANHTYTGFTNMTEIFILSMLTGGLAQLVIKGGGMEWILAQINKLVRDSKSAQLGIGSLVGIADMAVANNTVAILICGSIAKEISAKFNIPPHKTATILDIFSCILQGIIPYGAQILILLKFTEGAVDYFDILPYLWYQGLLFIIVVLSIYIPFADKYYKVMQKP